MSNRIVGKVRAEIEALALRNGGIITPQILVAYARDNPLSALHRCFQWDDEQAAEMWRLAQAGKLIRRHVVKIEAADGDTIRIRGFVSLPSDRGPDHTYRSTVRLLNDRDQTAELLAQAKAELAAFRNKYAALQAVAKMGPLFDAIDGIITS